MGLVPDGWVAPKGPTYKALNMLSAGAITGAEPNGKDQSDWLKSNFGLAGLVGQPPANGGNAGPLFNRPDDRLKVTNALGLYLPGKKLGLSQLDQPLSGEALGKALGDYEKANQLPVSGQAAPGGKTWTHLLGRIGTWVKDLPFGDAKTYAELTTPDPDKLHRILAGVKAEREERKPQVQVLKFADGVAEEKEFQNLRRALAEGKLDPHKGSYSREEIAEASGELMGRGGARTAQRTPHDEKRDVQAKDTRPDNPGDAWPAGPETDQQAAKPEVLPKGQPQEPRQRKTIASSIDDLMSSDEKRRSRAQENLGIWFADDPDYGDWLGHLSAIERGDANDDLIDAEQAKVLLSQQAKVIAAGGQPKNWEGTDVFYTWSQLSEIVQNGPKEGLPLGAELLQYFQSGKGGTKEVPAKQFFSYKLFQDEVSGLKDYFGEWLSGSRIPKNETELLTDRVFDKRTGEILLKEGESVTVNAEWQAGINNDFWDRLNLGIEKHLFDPGIGENAKDLYAALGAFLVVGSGEFTFKRVGDKVLFNASVNFSINEVYDFNPGNNFDFDVGERSYSFTAEQLNRLIDSHGAKPFTVQSGWTEQYVGELTQNLLAGYGGAPAMATGEWSGFSE